MPARPSSFHRLLALFFSTLALLGVGALLLWRSLPDVSELAWRIPPTTALVEQRRAEARRAGRPYRPVLTPVPIEQVSPRLVDAVVLAEDAGFFGHGPFDFREISKAVERNWESRRFARGASTLTQQLARNLYLGTEKSLWRKLREAVLAMKLERSLPKRRILAIYLNVAEWGDGIFGAESAARNHFGVSAREVATAQAAVLAGMLPAPLRADLAAPAPWLKRRARRVLDLLLEYGRIEAGEHGHASAELERLLMGPAPEGDEGAELPAE